MRRLPADQLCHSLSGLGGARHADMSVAERIYDVRSAAGGADHRQRIRHARSMAHPRRDVVVGNFRAQRGEHAARMSEQDAGTLPIGRRRARLASRCLRASAPAPSRWQRTYALRPQSECAEQPQDRGSSGGSRAPFRGECGHQARPRAASTRLRERVCFAQKPIAATKKWPCGQPNNHSAAALRPRDPRVRQQRLKDGRGADLENAVSEYCRQFCSG